MALAVINNATVNRTFFEGKGASIKETFQKRNGETGAVYFTAFFEEPHGLSEGDTGKFSGLLSARVNEYEKDGETRRSADIVLNNTRFEAAEGQSSDAEKPF